MNNKSTLNAKIALDFVAEVLGDVPAFGDTIGAKISKAQLAICHQAVLNAIAERADLLAALELVYANAGESPEWIRSRIGPAIARAKGGAS